MLTREDVKAIATGIPKNAPLAKNGVGHVGNRRRNLVFGTENQKRTQKRSKQPKKERPDSIYRPFAGYLWNHDLNLPHWDDSALLHYEAYRFPENWE